MNTKDLEKIRTRVLASKRVNLFFNEKLNVQAANNPFRLRRSKSEDILGGARLVSEMKKNITHASMFDITAKCHLGNCRELNSMSYMLLKSQQIILPPEHNVHLITTCDFDHVFVAISDKQFLPGVFNLEYLGRSCVIYDKWTSDYYLPNVSVCNQFKHGLFNLPNPYQLFVREKISSSRMKKISEISDL